MSDDGRPGVKLHERCGERLDCPCWLDGAREEGEMHRARVTTRQLTDYIRVLGDADPAMTERDVADAVARVFGSARSEAAAPPLDVVRAGVEAELALLPTDPKKMRQFEAGCAAAYHHVLGLLATEPEETT